MKQRYKNKKARFGSPQWCEQVASNENLTPYDHARLAQALRKAGNLKGLCTIHKLLKQRLDQKQETENDHSPLNP